MAEERSKTYLGSMQRAVLKVLDNNWQSVSVTCSRVRTLLEDPGLDRMRVANALRGLRERQLVASKREAGGNGVPVDRAPWFHRRNKATPS
jgi:hypothetical protein